MTEHVVTIKPSRSTMSSSEASLPVTWIDAMWAGQSSWSDRLLHVGVRSDLYHRPQRQAEAMELLIEQRG
jgi:hypothetical protein